MALETGGITHTSAWTDWGNSRMKRRLGYSVSLPRFEQDRICSAALSLVQLKIEKFIWTWSVLHKFLSFFFQKLSTKAIVRTSARSVPEDAMTLLRHCLPSGLSRPHVAYLGLYSVLHGFVSAIFTRMEGISSCFTFSGLVRIFLSKYPFLNTLWKFLHINICELLQTNICRSKFFLLSLEKSWIRSCFEPNATALHANKSIQHVPE